MMRPRLIALDIDGTLLPPGASHEALPDPQLTEVINQLCAVGVVVVLASGRMFPGTARIARHLRLTTPHICQQGASVHRPDGSVSHRCAIEPAIAHELVEFAREQGWPYAWFDAVRYLASAPNSASTEYARVSGIEPEYHAEPWNSGIAPTGIDVISTAAHAKQVHAVLSARYADRVHLLDFPTVTAAHAPEASKGNALSLLAAELGIARDDVLAIGDSVNDVSMLNWAGHSAAPAHADHYARAVANEMLAGEGVDGVTALLRRALRAVSD